MEKTLYISDLDGTLLDREGALTQYTISVIRGMIASGRLFTVATARSLQGAQSLIYLLGLKLPAVLNNGAVVYDPVKEDYIEVKTIPVRALPSILESLDRNNLCGFLFTLRDKKLTLYFERFRNDWDKVYHAHRIEQYEGRILQHCDLVRVAGERASICMVVYGPLGRLEAVRGELSRIRDVTVEVYNDSYNGYCFMDIFPSTASKAKGMLTLQKFTGADRMVAFGDNYNDLTMLLAADNAYVPRNAVDAAKRVATGVLDYNHRDGVARFLARELGWE